MFAWTTLALLLVGLLWGLGLLRIAEPPRRRWWWAWLGWLLVVAAVGVLAVKDLESQKLVGRLVMPLGLLWAGMLTLALWWLLDKRWGPALAALAAAVFLGVLGNPWVAEWTTRTWERDQPRSDPAVGQPLDAICVLGGGTAPGPDGLPHFGSSGDRLAVAMRAVRLGRAPLLVVSGSSIAGFDQPRDLADESRLLAIGLGMTPGQVVPLPGPRTTGEEIAAYLALAKERHWTRIGVVTSAWHLPRAMALVQRADFTAAGITVEPLPANWLGGDLPWSASLVVPTAGSLDGVSLIAWEALGMLMRR